MQMFLTKEAIRFHPGQHLFLTARQIKARSHNLKVLSSDKGISKVEAVKDIEFKRGEMIGLDGDLPRVIAAKLEAAEKADGKKLV